MQAISIHMIAELIYLALLLATGSASPLAPIPLSKDPMMAVRFEAEQSSSLLRGGVLVASSIAGFSGTGYVTGFKASGCEVEIKFAVPSEGLYHILIGYHAGFGDKGFDFRLNGGAVNSGTFVGSGAQWSTVI